MSLRAWAAVLCLAPLTAACDEPLAGLEERAFKSAVERVASSVVQIQTFGGLDRVGKTTTGTGPTSGLILSPDGYVMSSAFHFASKPSAVVVKLSDGTQQDARVVATDFSRMLTLLKIEASDLPVPEPTVVGEAKVGEWALAVGKAFDPVVPNASPGVISAKDRVWGKAIQTDAKTSPFNYGGPLLDIHGRVLGVIVPLSMTSDEVMAGAEWYDSGIGFAVPIDQVFASFERLRAGKDLHRGVLGLVTADPGDLFAPPIAEQVREGSAAGKAGLKKGDLIVAIDGRNVARQAEAMRALGPKYAGDEVRVTVRRDGQELSVTATLDEPADSSIVPPQETSEQPGEAEPGGESPNPAP